MARGRETRRRLEMEVTEQTEANRHLEAVRKSVQDEFPDRGVAVLVCSGDGNVSFSANVPADAMVVYLRTALKFLTEKA